MYVFGYKIAEIIDIFVKMNTNTTQTRFKASEWLPAWRRSDYKKQRAATAGASGSGSLSDKRLQAKAKAGAKASGAMISHEQQQPRAVTWHKRTITADAVRAAAAERELVRMIANKSARDIKGKARARTYARRPGIRF